MTSYRVVSIANDLAVCFVPALFPLKPVHLARNSFAEDSVTNLRSRFHTSSLKVCTYQARGSALRRWLTHCASTVPCNILLKKFKRPSTYIGILVVSWGIVMTFTGVVKDFAGLVTCRIFLGIAEAGFFPGVCVSRLKLR
jgi:hypothetical protein